MSNPKIETYIKVVKTVKVGNISVARRRSTLSGDVSIVMTMPDGTNLSLYDKDTYEQDARDLIAALDIIVDEPCLLKQP